MAIAVLEPSGEGTIADPTITYVGGAGNFTNLKLPDDDATTHVNLNDNPAAKSLYLSVLPSADSINANPTVTSRARKDTAGFTALFRHGFRITSSKTVEVFVESADQTWFTATSTALARPGGGTWVPNDFVGPVVGAAEFQTESEGNSGTNHNWSTCTATVDYVPTVGGFAYLMAAWIPPLMQVANHGLQLREMLEFYRSFKVRPGGALARLELGAINQNLLVRPRFVFLGA